VRVGLGEQQQEEVVVVCEGGGRRRRTTAARSWHVPAGCCRRWGMCDECRMKVRGVCCSIGGCHEFEGGWSCWCFQGAL
jgi:hypothetical protein